MGPDRSHPGSKGGNEKCGEQKASALASNHAAAVLQSRNENNLERNDSLNPTSGSPPIDKPLSNQQKTYLASSRETCRNRLPGSSPDCILPNKLSTSLRKAKRCARGSEPSNSSRLLIRKTISTAGSEFAQQRNASRICRLTKFLVTARLARRFATTNPSRGPLCLVSKTCTSRQKPRINPRRSRTAANSFGECNLCWVVKAFRR
jgi:hypothetical protein